MIKPGQTEKDVDVLKPVTKSHFPKNIFELYDNVHAFDIKISRAIYDFNNHYKVIYYPSKAIELFSDTIALPLFLLSYSLGRNPNPLAFSVYVIIFLLFAEFFVKNRFRRRRPEWTLKLGFAFPSSHAFTSGIAIATALLFPIEYRIIVVILGVIIGVSRIFLGHHYIVDVTIGFIFGIFIGIMWSILGAPLRMM